MTVCLSFFSVFACGLGKYFYTFRQYLTILICPVFLFVCLFCFVLFCFFLHTLALPVPKIKSTFPATVREDVQVAETHVGATRTLCVQGESPQTNTYWTKAGLRISAVSIPYTGCSMCGCLVNTNLNLSLGASPIEPRYSAFQVFGAAADSSGVLNFVSLLVIENAMFGDGGNYVFSIGDFPSTKTFVVREPGKSKTQNMSIS